MASNILELLEKVLLPSVEVLKKDVENTREVNKRLEDDINKLRERELQILQEMAGLREKVSNLEESIMLKLENRYLKKIIKTGEAREIEFNSSCYANL